MVVGLHCAVIIALMIGFTPRGDVVLVQDVKVDTVEEAVMSEEISPPPPPPDYLPPPQDFIPPPDFNVATEVSRVPSAMTTAPAFAAPMAVKPRPTPAKLTEKGLSSPSYPRESKRLGEEGEVTLALLLNDKGKVQEARVETSSGFARLDNAAVKHTTKSGQFEPCKDREKAVACSHKIKIRFQLKDI